MLNCLLNINAIFTETYKKEDYEDDTYENGGCGCNDDALCVCVLSVNELPYVQKDSKVP